MELVAVLLYGAIGTLVLRLSKGWIREDLLVAAGVVWPVTVLAWILAGLLLIPALFLASAGYLHAWWRERRPRQFGLRRHLSSPTYRLLSRVPRRTVR